MCFFICLCCEHLQRLCGQTDEVVFFLFAGVFFSICSAFLYSVVL